MGLLPNEQKALKELKFTLAENFQLLDFRIFGSKAVETDIEDSDLDVMIVLEGLSPTIESRIDDLIFDINLKFDCFITAIFFSCSQEKEDDQDGILVDDSHLSWGYRTIGICPRFFLL